MAKTSMNLTINNKQTEVCEGCTVAQIVEQLRLPEAGTALAVNNQLIPRAKWATQQLREGDSLIIIKAACGG